MQRFCLNQGEANSIAQVVSNTMGELGSMETHCLSRYLAIISFAALEIPSPGPQLFLLPPSHHM
jgi:hypothetical protein